MKLIEKKVGENLHSPRLDKEFLDMPPKAQQIKDITH